jgi:hypothetical protein
MRLIDKESESNCPTSKFLSRKEFAELFPDRMPRRMNFLFKYNVPLIVEEDIGIKLIDKYPNALDVCDKVEKLSDEPKLDVKPVSVEKGKSDELDKMKYQKLKALAVNYGIPYKRTFVKKPELIALIRWKKNAGVIPLPDKIKELVE